MFPCPAHFARRPPSSHPTLLPPRAGDSIAKDNASPEHVVSVLPGSAVSSFAATRTRETRAPLHL